jgi:hypothetical protein
MTMQLNPEGGIDADMIEIHLDSPTPVDLIRRHADNADWWTVCTSPCDVKVPKADSFMIIGKDIHRSKPFQIDPSRQGRVNIRVLPGLKDKRKLGLYVLGGSGVVALAGIITLAAGITPDSTFKNDGQTHNENQTAIAAGSILIVAAAMGAMTGGAWAYDNAKTRVMEAEGPDSKFDEKKQARIPQVTPWANQASSPTWMFPLLRGSF